MLASGRRYLLRSFVLASLLAHPCAAQPNAVEKMGELWKLEAGGYYCRAQEQAEQMLAQPAFAHNRRLHLLHGYSLLHQGETVAAGREFKFLVNSDPSDVLAAEGMALLALFEGNCDTSLKIINKTIVQKGQLERLYRTRAKVYLVRGEYAKCASDYERAIQLGASQSWRLQQAEAFVALRDFKAAERCVDLGYAAFPDDPFWLARKADVLWLSKNKELCLQCFQKGLPSLRKLASYWNVYISWLMEHNIERSTIERAVSQALVEMPNDSSVLKTCAQVYACQHQFEQAARLLSPLLRNDSEAFVQYIDLLIACGRTSEAGELIKRARTEVPDQIALQIARLRLLTQQNGFDGDVTVLLNDLLRLEPVDASQYVRRARYLGSLGQRSVRYATQTESDFRHACLLGRSSDYMNEYLVSEVRVLLAQEKNEEARRLALFVYRRYTDAANARFAGEIMKTLRLPDEAIALYLKAIEMDPGNIWARASLGTLAFRIQRYKQSFDQLTEAENLAIFANHPLLNSIRFDRAKAAYLLGNRSAVNAELVALQRSGQKTTILDIQHQCGENASKSFSKSFKDLVVTEKRALNQRIEQLNESLLHCDDPVTKTRLRKQLGELCFQSGRYPDALSQYKLLDKRGDCDYFDLSNYAAVYFALGDKQRSEELRRAAVALYSNTYMKKNALKDSSAKARSQ